MSKKNKNVVKTDDNKVLEKIQEELDRVIKEDDKNSVNKSDKTEIDRLMESYKKEEKELLGKESLKDNHSFVKENKKEENRIEKQPLKQDKVNTNNNKVKVSSKEEKVDFNHLAVKENKKEEKQPLKEEKNDFNHLVNKNNKVEEKQVEKIHPIEVEKVNTEQINKEEKPLKEEIKEETIREVEQHLKEEKETSKEEVVNEPSVDKQEIVDEKVITDKKELRRQKKELKKLKKKNKSKAYRICEFIFVSFSIIAILVIMGIYAYRAYYYYTQENYVKEDAKIVDVIFNKMNVIYMGDGLYKVDDNNYYFYGKNVNNYLSFDGRMYRIMGLDKNGIKLITDDIQTSLVWGGQVIYDASVIYNWLNKDGYITTIKNTDLLGKGEWCIDNVDIQDYKCELVTEDYIGLLSTEEYLRAGGVNSYLNINNYYWTLNNDSEYKAYYVHNNGGLNNDIGHNNTLYSYGVRPVIYLNNKVIYSGGDGTKDNPYVIVNNNDIKIGNHFVGDYVLYNNYKFRIMNVTEEYTQLILDGYILDDEGEKVKVTYGNVNSYLNDNFINKFNEEDLVKTKYLLTEYNNGNSYDYNSQINEYEGYFGIPTIGMMFVNEYSDYWLNTYNNRGLDLVYKTMDNASVMADLTNEENYLRPIISIKNDLIISGGTGKVDNPYIIGDNIGDNE